MRDLRHVSLVRALAAKMYARDEFIKYIYHAPDNHHAADDLGYFCSRFRCS
jgi:hypothetical protein